MLIVQKYGGSSVADTEGVYRVARKILNTYKAGNSVVVVVSAQGKTTDFLIKKSAEIAEEINKRELDVLLATGEQQSMALLSMAIKELGGNAVSLTGNQAGIYTDDNYGSARIKHINPKRIKKELENNRIVIVAGFQGINEIGDITTLGRGGSDTTAVALAAALKADRCDIYSDVDGIYTADPRIVKNASKLTETTYDEMLELASLGAKVLHNRSVEMAKRYKVKLMSGSSFTDSIGTYVKEKCDVEDLYVRGVAGDKDVAIITVTEMQDKPGNIYKIFDILAKEKISVDIIAQSNNKMNKTDVSFTVKRTELKKTIKLITENLERVEAGGVVFADNCAKVSIVGAGMVNNPGVAATMFEAMYDENIKIHLISTSEIKISLVIDEDELETALNAVHRKFKLHLINEE